MPPGSHLGRLQLLQRIAPAGTKRLWFRSQLEAELGLPRRTIAHWVDSLLAKGLLERVPATSQKVPLRITARGLAYLEEHRSELTPNLPDDRKEALCHRSIL